MKNLFEKIDNEMSAYEKYVNFIEANAKSVFINTLDIKLPAEKKKEFEVNLSDILAQYAIARSLNMTKETIIEYVNNNFIEIL